MKITRRRFLELLGAAAAAAVLGGTLYSLLKPEKRQLKVYNYSYYVDPSVIDKFEELYGAEVIYDEYEAAEEAFTKIQLGSEGYDLIILTDSYIRQAVDEGLIRLLDHSLILNLRTLIPGSSITPSTPRFKYAVPHMWGTTGIGYNSKYVRESEIEGYEQLFNTENFLPAHKARLLCLRSS